LDLSEFLETKVEVHIFSSANNPYTSDAEGYFNTFKLIDRVNPHLVTDVYSESKELLSWEAGDTLAPIPQRFSSTLLRSNCRVTNQPDAGDVFISITSSKIIDQESLLKYIISFRNECHFHEEVCECIYTRLNEVYAPTELLVMCFYVRRGSLDINPIRASKMEVIPGFLLEPKAPYAKFRRQ
jgi:7-cyano-7-deazaguanine reductase